MLSNGRKTQQQEPQMTIQTDASTNKSGEWSKKEQGHCINVLELVAVKFSILTSQKISQI